MNCSTPPVTVALRFFCAVGLVASFLLGPSLVTDAQAQTTLPLIQQQDLIYEGAFLFPEGPGNNNLDEMTFNNGGHGLTHRAESNTLFAFGSLCCTPTIAEITIPDIRIASSLSSLARSSYVQAHADPFGILRAGIPCGNSMNGLLPYAGTLIASAYCTFDAGFQQNKSHFRTSTQTVAAPGPTVGPIEIQSPATGDGRAGFVSGWMATVPAEWQALLGGDGLTGNCCVSIITRTSWGPSASVLNLADIGVREPVPATALVGYTGGNPLEPAGSQCDAQSTLFNCATKMGGMVFPKDTRSLLFIGHHGLGQFCYGEGTTDPAKDRTIVPGTTDVLYCYDPAYLGKAPHAYPYVHYIWAYDANDLLRVKNGQAAMWDVRPYAVWSFDTPFQNDLRWINGVTYDPATQRIFIAIKDQDGPRPVIHVYKVRTSGSSTTDTQFPSATVTAPTAGASVTGSITLAANAADNVGVAGVWFSVDGVTVGAEDRVAPYSVSWSSQSVANGTHQVRAYARDAAGNTTTSSPVSITVSNATSDILAPVVLMTSPAAGSSVSGTVMLAANATDNIGVVRVEFKINGVVLGSDTSAPFSTPWDTSSYAAGGYYLTATAFDAVGNNSTSTAMSVSVSGPADSVSPTVSIAAPLAGTAVTGVVTVSALASDNVGVADVRFALDGTTIGAADNLAPYVFTWDTTHLTNGAHYLTATARDFAGNTTTSAATWVTVSNGVSDSTPPTVSIASPSGGSTVAGSVTVTAQVADNVGVAALRFAVDGNPVGSEIVPPFQFTWNTTGLANGAHYVTATARDAANNRATSSAVWVMVTNDPSAPTVSVSVPANGAVVSGAVTMAAQASDNIGVVGVRFKVDGVFFGTEDLSAPYQQSWNTSSLSNGPHYVQAVARDAANNVTTSAASWVTISNSTDTSAPSVSITSPSNGATVTGRITVSATATDNVGVAGVQFLVDGAPAGSEVTSAPFSYSWSTAGVSNGSHTLSATARDAAGNRRTSTLITVTVNNTVTDTTPPTVSVTAPAASSTVSGAVSITATASDNVAVASVRFTVDGVALGNPITAAPYGLVWQSTQVTNGFHTIRAIARDTSGNEQTSLAVNVYVSNVATSDTVAPVIAFTSPANGATVGGNVFFAVTATDNVGVVGVRFAVDGVNVGSEDLTAPYEFSWRTQTLPARSYVITATARDAAGNRASASITITVRNNRKLSASAMSARPDLVMAASSSEIPAPRGDAARPTPSGVAGIGRPARSDADA